MTAAIAAPGRGALHVFAYHLIGYRRTWWGTAFSSFLLPLIYLAGIGLGVGGYVDRGHQLGVDYLSFLAPGVLAATGLSIAIDESMYRVYSQFAWDRTYEGMLNTPLRIVDIVLGQLAFVVFRALVAVTVFLLVMAAFGTVHSGWAVGVLPTAMLLALACAAPTFAFTASQHTDSSFAVLTRFVVIPVQLFSGVFFPIAQLPAGVRVLAWLSPLWHGVEVCRSLTLGTPRWWPVLGHLGYLALWAAVGLLLAHRAFRRRLVV
jgi:lipooligosaccharide transport system permease protein